jgi:amino acid permease
MSESTHIEPFEIEAPEKTNNTINNAGEETNDNIIFQEESSENKNNRANYKGGSDSELTCILNIIVSTIGAGAYSLPYVMYQGGIIVSLLLLILVSLASYYSLDLLRSFVVDTKFFSFALMTETILGPKWLKTYAFCSFTLYTSIEVGYLRSIYIYTKGMINLKSHLSIFFYFVISIIIEIIVCLNGTRIANLRFLSIIIISCFSLMLVSLIIVSIAANIFGNVKEKFTSNNLFFPGVYPPNCLNRMFHMSLYIMIYNFCYSYHSTFPTILGNLKGVTQAKTKRVHFISFTCVFSAYILITFFGFIFTDDVPNELFQDNDELFQGIWAALRNPFRFILILFLLFLLPIRFIVLRDNYITLIGKKKMTFKKETIIIAIFTIICNIIVFSVTEFEDSLKELQIKSVLQAFGGIFGVIISFCLPVVNYVSINGKRKLKSIIGYVILVIFVWIGVFSTGHSFYYIFSGKQKE